MVKSKVTSRSGKKKEFAREVEFTVVPTKRGGKTVKARPIIRPPSPIKRMQQNEDPPFASMSNLDEEELVRQRNRKSGQVNKIFTCSVRS
jgi:hypothetical protein